MSTVTVVKKNGVVAIAADTLTKWGSGKESATYIANPGKILKVGVNYLAYTGSTTTKYVLTDYFAGAKAVDLSDADAIFRTWQKLHGALKEKYFLRPEENDDDAYESTRSDVLIANPHGIFGVSGHRTVQEFSTFYAFGSGFQLALGALFAAYGDPEKDAEALARLGVAAAAEFDDATGEPIDSYAIPLLRSG